MVALGFSPEVFLALMVFLFSYCHFGNVKCSFGLLHILLNLSWLAVFYRLCGLCGLHGLMPLSDPFVLCD